MKNALQIILAEIIGAMTFHRIHGSASGDEFRKTLDKRYGS
jgi:hypothetical protein